MQALSESSAVLRAIAQTDATPARSANSQSPCPLSLLKSLVDISHAGTMTGLVGGDATPVRFGVNGQRFEVRGQIGQDGAQTSEGGRNEVARVLRNADRARSVVGTTDHHGELDSGLLHLRGVNGSHGRRVEDDTQNAGLVRQGASRNEAAEACRIVGFGRGVGREYEGEDRDGGEGVSVEVRKIVACGQQR